MDCILGFCEKPSLIVIRKWRVTQKKKCKETVNGVEKARGKEKASK